MAREFVEQFFGTQGIPPVCRSRPGDAVLVQRIEKVAEFAARNGPDFVQLIENKQLHNPEFGFLFGGEGHDYYRWRLYKLLTGQPMEVLPVEDVGPLSASALLERVSLPLGIGREFAELLDRLDGSKDSMRACQHCFLKNTDESAELGKLMYHRTLQLKDAHRQMDIAYLIRDILVKSDGHSTDREFGEVTGGLQDVIGPIFAAIVARSNQDDDAKHSQLSWEDHDIFSQRTIDAMEQTMLSGNTELQPAREEAFHRSEDSARRRHHRSEHWDQKSTQKPSAFGLPPHMASSKPPSSHTATRKLDQGSRWEKEGPIADNRPTTAASGRSKTRAAFDPPPERLSQSRVVDAFSFPPGLIPSLVSEKRKRSFSYCPISSADVQKTLYPSAVDANDPYLKSRMEKFYAELDEYRPGMIREHVESRKRKEETEVEPETVVDSRRRRTQRTVMALTEENKMTATLPDGSFAGEGSESMYAGLGANASTRQTQEDKAFNEYRRLRSDVYHSVIPKGPPPPAPREG